MDKLSAMHADMFVVRHGESGAPHFIARHVAPDDPRHQRRRRRHSHPTQGLLDMYTIRHYKKDFTNLRVAIVGDILHSRVARSAIHALSTLGCPEIRVIAAENAAARPRGADGRARAPTLGEGLKGVRRGDDAAAAERAHAGALLPSAQEFYKYYGLTGTSSRSPSRTLSCSTRAR